MGARHDRKETEHDRPEAIEKPAPDGPYFDEFECPERKGRKGRVGAQETREEAGAQFGINGDTFDRLEEEKAHHEGTEDIDGQNAPREGMARDAPYEQHLPVSGERACDSEDGNIGEGLHIEERPRRL